MSTLSDPGSLCACISKNTTHTYAWRNEKTVLRSTGTCTHVCSALGGRGCVGCVGGLRRTSRRGCVLRFTFGSGTTFTSFTFGSARFSEKAPLGSFTTSHSRVPALVQRGSACRNYHANPMQRPSGGEQPLSPMNFGILPPSLMRKVGHTSSLTWGNASVQLKTPGNA